METSEDSPLSSSVPEDTISRSQPSGTRYHCSRPSSAVRPSPLVTAPTLQPQMHDFPGNAHVKPKLAKTRATKALRNRRKLFTSCVADDESTMLLSLGQSSSISDSQDAAARTSSKPAVAMAENVENIPPLSAGPLKKNSLKAPRNVSKRRGLKLRGRRQLVALNNTEDDSLFQLSLGLSSRSSSKLNNSANPVTKAEMNGPSSAVVTEQVDIEGNIATLRPRRNLRGRRCLATSLTVQSDSSIQLSLGQSSVQEHKVHSPVSVVQDVTHLSSIDENALLTAAPSVHSVALDVADCTSKTFVVASSTTASTTHATTVSLASANPGNMSTHIDFDALRENYSAGTCDAQLSYSSGASATEEVATEGSIAKLRPRRGRRRLASSETFQSDCSIQRTFGQSSAQEQKAHSPSSAVMQDATRIDENASSVAVPSAHSVAVDVADCTAKSFVFASATTASTTYATVVSLASGSRAESVNLSAHTLPDIYPAAPKENCSTGLGDADPSSIMVNSTADAGPVAPSTNQQTRTRTGTRGRPRRGNQKSESVSQIHVDQPNMDDRSRTVLEQTLPDASTVSASIMESREASSVLSQVSEKIDVPVATGKNAFRRALRGRRLALSNSATNNSLMQLNFGQSAVDMPVPAAAQAHNTSRVLVCDATVMSELAHSHAVPEASPVHVIPVDVSRVAVHCDIAPPVRTSHASNIKAPAAPSPNRTITKDAEEIRQSDNQSSLSTQGRQSSMEMSLTKSGIEAPSNDNKATSVGVPEKQRYNLRGRHRLAISNTVDNESLIQLSLGQSSVADDKVHANANVKSHSQSAVLVGQITSMSHLGALPEEASFCPIFVDVANPCVNPVDVITYSPPATCASRVMAVPAPLSVCELAKDQSTYSAEPAKSLLVTHTTETQITTAPIVHCTTTSVSIAGQRALRRNLRSRRQLLASGVEENASNIQLSLGELSANGTIEEPIPVDAFVPKATSPMETDPDPGILLSSIIQTRHGEASANDMTMEHVITEASVPKSTSAMETDSDPGILLVPYQSTKSHLRDCPVSTCTTVTTAATGHMSYTPDPPKSLDDVKIPDHKCLESPIAQFPFLISPILPPSSVRAEVGEDLEIPAPPRLSPSVRVPISPILPPSALRPQMKPLAELVEDSRECTPDRVSIRKPSGILASRSLRVKKTVSFAVPHDVTLHDTPDVSIRHTRVVSPSEDADNGTTSRCSISSPTSIRRPQLPWTNPTDYKFIPFKKRKPSASFVASNGALRRSKRVRAPNVNSRSNTAIVYEYETAADGHRYSVPVGLAIFPSEDEIRRRRRYLKRIHAKPLTTPERRRIIRSRTNRLQRLAKRYRRIQSSPPRPNIRIHLNDDVSWAPENDTHLPCGDANSTKQQVIFASDAPPRIRCSSCDPSSYIVPAYSGLLPPTRFTTAPYPQFEVANELTHIVSEDQEKHRLHCDPNAVNLFKFNQHHPDTPETSPWAVRIANRAFHLVQPSYVFIPKGVPYKFINATGTDLQMDRLIFT